jgi:hypothetical protein
MSHTAHYAAKLAVSTAKAAIAATDVAFTTSINSPPILSPSMTAGEMLIATTKAGDFSIQNLARKTLAIRRELQAKMNTADGLLEQANKDASAYADLGDYLVGKTSVVPSGLPQPVTDAARIVRRSAEAGLVSPQTLADEVKRHSMSALVMIGDSRKQLARVKSAGQVAFAHRAHKAYTKAAADTGYNSADRRRLEMTSHKLAASYSGNKRKHAERFFEDAELAKTYRGIELRHSGGEIGK